MKRLRNSTETIDAPFVRSAFVGNAGVIEFTPGTTLALKAETHNHPSAVEPFGGANTGVGGVIRDVLGMAHRPILVTDVLCFGPADLPIDDLPAGSLHPLRIRAGVVDGVADYGNKIGLPTVAGAVLYDPAYTTNPLVFAGCIGVAPDPARPRRPPSRRPDRRPRWSDRTRRHPRCDVLVGHDGCDHRRGRRRQRPDRRPGRREAADRRARRRGGPVLGHHRLRCRRPVVGGRRDGRGGRRRRRSRPGAAQVPGPRAVGGLAVGGPGAHGGVDRRRSTRRARRSAAGASASTSPTSASSPGPASSSSAPAATWSPTSTPRSSTTHARSGR